MQNHLEISSKTQFGTRNVRNWSKGLTESLRKVYGTSKTCPEGPIRAHIFMFCAFILDQSGCLQELGLKIQGHIGYSAGSAKGDTLGSY